MEHRHTVEYSLTDIIQDLTHQLDAMGKRIAALETAIQEQRNAMDDDMNKVAGAIGQEIASRATYGRVQADFQNTPCSDS